MPLWITREHITIAHNHSAITYAYLLVRDGGCAQRWTDTGPVVLLEPHF